MEKISVTIITKNEEANIERCLKSVQCADEVLIVDSGSTDRTLEICKKYSPKIIEIEWMGFGKTKKFAVENAKYYWILSLDADEEVTKELPQKIKHILDAPKYDAYKIKRRSFYLNKMIKFSGWQNDFPLRLFNKNFGNFNEKIIHEHVETKSKTGLIKEYILHHTYKSTQEHFVRMINYAELSALQKYEMGKSSSVLKAIIGSISKFFKMYILRFGFLDGKKGFLLALNSSIGIYFKYIRLWELCNNKEKEKYL